MFSSWLRRKTAALKSARRPSRRKGPRRSRLESLECRRVLTPVINEIHFSPLSGNLEQDQYVEIRGDANETLANGTYLIAVNGNDFVNTPGVIHTVFNLSGLQLGSNGFLVLNQQSNGYTVDPAATLLTGASGGFGGLKADSDPMGTDRYSDTNAGGNSINAGAFESNTYFLIQSAVAPTAGQDVDANNDGVLNAGLNWTILDGVSVLDGGDGEVAYANLVFAVDGDGVTPAGAQVVNTKGLYPISWVGRNGDTTGSTPAEWIAGQTQERGSDTFVFKLNNNTVFPPVFAGRNFDHLGAPNFHASVQGVVFNDANGDGAQQGGENGVSGVTVYLDVNNNGILDDYTTEIEPDDFPDGTIVQNRTAGITLTVMDPFTNFDQTPEETIPVTVQDNADYSSTGIRVFAHAGVDFFADIRQLRMDFYRPAKAISIDVTSFVGTTVGRLSVFDAAGNELDFDLSNPLADKQSETLTVIRPQADIVYAVAYSEPGEGLSPFGRFDHLLFTLTEPSAVSGGDGSYEIAKVVSEASQLPGFEADYTVRQILPPGYIRTVPVSGSYDVTATTTANITDKDFGVRENQAPEIEDQTFEPVVENTPPGSVVGIVNATESDPGQTLHFAITGGTGAGLFNINSASGTVTVAVGAELDFETEESYTIEITVTDDAPTPASSEATVTIDLTDDNEPPTDISLSTNDIPENVDTSGGQVLVAILSADDPDENAIVNFTLVGLGNDNGFFVIVGNQLFLQQGVVLDYESATTLTLLIEAGDDSEAYQETITINVTDVDEPPTEVTLDPDTVSEDAATETMVLVGYLGTDDPDPNFLYTFEVVGGANAGLFEIVDAQLFIKEGAELDFETQPELLVDVKASDGVHEVTSTLTVHVTDANDAPQIADQTFNVDENSSTGTVVGTIAAGDDDDGQTLAYSVLGGSGGGIFDVNPDTGEITVLDEEALDFEAVQSFDLLIEVTDSAEFSLSSQATITIELNDLNDVPTAVELNGSAVSEDADTSGGSVFVGQLVSVGGPAETFELVPGAGDTHNDLFVIQGDSLHLAQGATLDYETEPVLLIRVRATSGNASAESILTVDVTDVNEPPTGIGISNDTVVDTADTSSGPVTVGDLMAIDPDDPEAFDDYTFTLEAGAGGDDNDSFQITDGALQFKQGVTLEHSVKDSYAVRVRAGDGLHSIVETFTINVVPPNEAPFAQADSKITQISQAVTIMVLANDGDSDGILDPLSVTIVALPANGAVEVNADGTITYTPAAAFEGQDTFEYTVADDQGAVSNAALVTIHVGPTWQNPIENLDIDGNTFVNILDLLAIVNFLRDHGVGHALDGPPGPGDPMIDVDGDGVAEIGDLLALVQYLRENQGNAEPEGEAEEQIAAPMSQSSVLFALDDDDDPWADLVDEVAKDVANA